MTLRCEYDMAKLAKSSLTPRQFVCSCEAVKNANLGDAVRNICYATGGVVASRRHGDMAHGCSLILGPVLPHDRSNMAMHTIPLITGVAYRVPKHWNRGSNVTGKVSIPLSSAPQGNSET